jgi:pimeloyl-ACP methyl ester carboxylesterase
MADDVVAVVSALGGGPVDAFGHSMGGAALLLAERRAPGTLRRAALYEPIVRTAAWFPAGPDGENRMAGPARHRRGTFASRADAMWRYAARPPLAEMRADALAAYVEFGFVDEPDGSVQLACPPEHEARTFEGAGTMTVEMCADVTTPILVGAGETDVGPGPAEYAGPVAAALPAGSLITYAHLGHFGPFQDPVGVAADVIRFLND